MKGAFITATRKAASGIKNGLRSFSRSQLLIPVLALLAIVLINLVRLFFGAHNFFEITMGTTTGGIPVLGGNIINIVSQASELAILAMGMTLVTAASGGQDISVGAAATIAGGVFARVLMGMGQISFVTMLVAILCAVAVAILCGAFNGALVSVLKIQPMIATLILFTCGRSIATKIIGADSELVLEAPPLQYIGGNIRGIPFHTSILVVIVFGVLMALVLKFTNLRLYTQAVGINGKAARLNGINTVWIKMLTFMILGVCVAVAASVNAARNGTVKPNNMLDAIEMDAILAVAIGGNALSGGKFSMVGSVLGAYILRALETTLLSIGVSPVSIKAWKAGVIIVIVLLGSSIVKDAVSRAWKKFFIKAPRKKPDAQMGDT